MTPEIRPFENRDAQETYRVFYTAVRETAASHYPQKHLEAWASNAKMGTDWAARLEQQITLVACAPDICGFITLAPTGYLDFLYTAPSHTRQGIGSALYEALLEDKRTQQIAEFSTEASHLSRLFFLSKGWQEIAPQKVERHGQWITNFQMTFRR